jgi:hypothetical protein
MLLIISLFIIRFMFHAITAMVLESANKTRLGGRLIRLQRIYNFLLFHAIILSVLDVLYALICYFILFLGLTY